MGMSDRTAALSKEVVSMALTRGMTVSTAESCTGGMIAAALTTPPGASDMYHRGFVTYSDAAKTDMLGVHAETLVAFGAVSEPVVREMAKTARQLADSSVAVAVSGIAGPGGSGLKPEGRVCFAVASVRGETCETIEFGALGRDNVRDAACDYALELLLKGLREAAP